MVLAVAVARAVARAVVVAPMGTGRPTFLHARKA